MAFLHLVYIVPIWITCCLPNYAFSTQSHQTVNAPHYDFLHHPANGSHYDLFHHPANGSHSDLFQHSVNASYNDLLQHPVNASDFSLTDSPCPNAEDIAPCTCEYVEGTGMNMNCNDIADENQLYDIFHSLIPFPQFSKLILDISNVESLSANVFGNATFEQVSANYGILKYVDPETFIKSTATLTYISLSNNDLVTFPFDTIKHYTKINYLNLGGNPINIFPIIESQTLTNLDLHRTLINTIPDGAIDGLPSLSDLNLWTNHISNFPILASQSLTTLNIGETLINTIPEGAFDRLPNLQNIAADNTKLDTMASGLFTSLSYLKHIELYGGRLTHLQSFQFELNMNCHLDSPIFLFDNEISVVDIDTFKGIQSGTIIDLGNNLLSILPEATWGPVIDAGVTLWLEGNILTCGCDIAWIVLEPSYHQYFPDAICHGQFIWSLDPGLYEHCRTVANETSAQHN